MPNIIADGTSQLASSDFTVVAGSPSTLFMTTTDGSPPSRECYAHIQAKSAGGQYMNVGTLGRGTPALVIDGPGTFRVLRMPSPTAFGVDRE